jgi:polysaccharide export outer membrane protein
MISRIRKLLVVTAWLALTAALAPPAARAEDYVLGPDDVIAVSVWGHPELERTVTVGSDGNITFAPIGDVKATGQTTKQLADRLGDRLSQYLRVTAQVTITVKEFMSHSVFVSGAVARPARYGFERIPNLVDVISAAGGAVPGADLANVQVVRREGDARRTLPADVASALRDGVIANLPALKPGDTVIVPGGATGTGGSFAASDGVGVLGEVTRPGVYPATGGQDLWVILAGAGGLTPRGNLSDVRIVTRQGQSQAVVSVNLKDVLKHGSRSLFVVRPGDIVFVNSTGTGAAARTFNAFVNTLPIAVQVLNIVVLSDLYRKNGN